MSYSKERIVRPEGLALMKTMPFKLFNLLACSCAFLVLYFTPAHSFGRPRQEQPAVDNGEYGRAELSHFPFNGLGDAVHSFHHPFVPSSNDAISHWRQAGTATAATSHDGRDIVKLTPPSQGSQGLIYNLAHTGTNNFNGFVDIKIETSPQSRTAADGMGIFFSKSLPKHGSAMGMHDRFTGLGIIIDTYANTKKRKMPYMYAYVSDGTKDWNPDGDGTDSEVAPGCTLELDKVVRVYIRYVHETLHVAYSLTQGHEQNEWHTCFVKENLKLPFQGGGYFAVAGETGYYFSVHEVYSAQFVVDEEYWNEDVEELFDDESLSDVAGKQAHADDYAKAHEKPEAQGKSGEHHATAILTGALDANMRDLHDQLIMQFSKAGSGMSTQDRDRMDTVQTLSTQLVDEVTRQATDMKNVVENIGRMRKMIEELAGVSDKFSKDIQVLENSLRSLHYASNDLKSLHEGARQELKRGKKVLRDKVKRLASSSKGAGSMWVLFVLAQVMMGLTAYVILKMDTSVPKYARMV